MNRIIGVLLLLAALVCLCPARNVHAETDAAFKSRMSAAERAHGIARTGLGRAVDFAGSRPDLFGRRAKTDLLTRDEKLAVWSTWSAMLDGLAALDAIRSEWKGFHLFEDEYERNVSYALNQAAFLASYRYALEFIELTDRNDSLNDILNEAVPEMGLTGGNFSRFKFRFLNVSVATEFAARQVVAEQYGMAGVQEALRFAIE